MSEDMKTKRGQNVKALLSSAGSKRGTYSAGLTVVIVAIAVVLSLMTGLLPEDLKAIDISDNKVYTIGETTEELLASLENNLSFTVIAEPDTMDNRIERLIKQYTSRSDRITLTEIDPVKSPAEVTAVGGAANSIIVTNEDDGKSTAVSFDDILVVDPYSYYYGTSDAVEFDGEGQLTGAIHYVTSKNTSRLYLTNGHGESALPASITERLDKLSLPSDSLSLLMSGGVPDDCSLLIVFAPASDISEDEKTVLSEYLARGGALMYVAGYEAVRLPVFESLLAEYGISFVEGYIADVERYYQDSPYNIFPVLDDVHDITNAFGTDELALLIQSQGFLLTDPARDTIFTQSFMTTSETGGVAVTDASQTEGQYVLGATATEQVSGENAETRIAAIASASIVEEQILTSFPSLVNADLFIASITWFIDDVVNISIPSKSLAITYNTVSGGAGWRALFVFIIPAALIAGGLFVWLRRRRA